MSEILANYLADLREEETFAEVKKELDKGTDPQEIFNELQRGMEIIGDRFQTQEYYLSELIMAANIFKKAVEPLQEELKKTAKETIGTIVLGTVAGDIHDIGKNIVGLFFETNGFKVVDLGVDVPPSKFVEAVQGNQPQFVGLSCLLTTGFDSMKDTVAALKEAGLRDKVKILVGGGPVDESVRKYANADYYCVDAPAGVNIAKKLLGVA